MRENKLCVSVCLFVDFQQDEVAVELKKKVSYFCVFSAIVVWIIVIVWIVGSTNRYYGRCDRPFNENQVPCDTSSMSYPEGQFMMGFLIVYGFYFFFSGLLTLWISFGRKSISKGTFNRKFEEMRTMKPKISLKVFSELDYVASDGETSVTRKKHGTRNFDYSACEDIPCDKLIEIRHFGDVKMDVTLKFGPETRAMLERIKREVSSEAVGIVLIDVCADFGGFLCCTARIGDDLSVHFMQRYRIEPWACFKLFHLILFLAALFPFYQTFCLSRRENIFVEKTILTRNVY
eukprot:Phypoly_transcript_12930.p1 GENE.Phypoly_transcript_12930~~Phypoly_transcript_12930.p1  ORF type:complete len:290 (+),score=18.17 Phypoly_transcript_12930:98-967(+)